MHSISTSETVSKVWSSFSLKTFYKWVFQIVKSNKGCSGSGGTDQSFEDIVLVDLNCKSAQRTPARWRSPACTRCGGRASLRGGRTRGRGPCRCRWRPWPCSTSPTWRAWAGWRRTRWRRPRTPPRTRTWLVGRGRAECRPHTKLYSIDRGWT